MKWIRIICLLIIFQSCKKNETASSIAITNPVNNPPATRVGTTFANLFAGVPVFCMSIDKNDNVYAGDIGGIWKFNSNGIKQYYVNGICNNCIGLAIDELTSSIYVSDNNSRIIKLSISGSLLNQYFITNSYKYRSLFFDQSGFLYASTANNGVLKFSTNTGNLVTGGVTSTNFLDDVFVDATGNIYVVDLNNHRVTKTNLNGNTVVVAGGNGAGSNLNQLNQPASVFVDLNDNLYISEIGNNRVTKWAKGSTSGVIVAGGNGQGNASNQFDSPIDVWLDSKGNIFVADMYNYRIQKWPPFN